MIPRSIHIPRSWRGLGPLVLLLTLLSWALPGLAQISVRSSAQAGVTSGTLLVIPKPPGTNTGDVLVAAISMIPGGGGRNIATPAGWVSRSNVVSGTTPRLAVFTRVVPAADASVTSYAFTLTGAAHSGAAGGITAFIGVDPAAPINVQSTNAPTPSGFIHTAPTVTTTLSGTMLVSVHTMGGATGNWTPPTGMTERVDVASTPTRPVNSGVALTMATEPRPAAGATGTRAATAEDTGITAAPGRAQSLALRPAVVNRYRLEHDSGAHSCAAESIAVFACANAACTLFFNAGATGTVVAGGNSVPFTIPVGEISTTVALLLPTTSGPPDPETVRLGIGSASPVPLTARSCRNGAGTVNTTTACDVSVADAGLVVAVANHVSDTEQTVTIQATQRSAGVACVPQFASVTRNVGFWASYLNPSTGTHTVTLGGSSLGTVPPGTPLSLAFNASGVATTTLRYADVGALRLQARYAGSGGTGDAGLVVTGQDDFIAKPRDFLLTVSGSGPGGATDASGPVFARAGVPFTATVTARNHNGVATPNFGREAVPEGVRLESTLQAPLGGNNPMPVAAPGFGAFVGGVATGQWRWDEVGVITLTPRLADGDYLGYGTPAQPAPGNIPDVVGTALANVGRFIPARLAITANTPVLANACAAGSFGYVGQEFGFATNPQLTVSGRNALGAITGNYVNAGGAANAFWRLGGTLANRGYVNTAIGTLATLSRTTDGGNASVDEQTGPPFDGTGRVTISGDRLTYAKPVAPEAPFNALIRLDLSAADLTDSDGVCFDNAQDGCDPLAIAGITGTQQRWGRIALTSAFAPELLDLQLPMRAEFFNGTAFVANPDDVCSVVSIAPLVDANPADALLPAETCVQDSGSPGASGQGCSVAGPLVQRYTPSPPIGGGGHFVFWLRAPGAGNAGILDVTANVPAWLQFNWRGTGLTAPRARVGFGVFQGDRRAIFRREVY